MAIFKKKTSATEKTKETSKTGKAEASKVSSPKSEKKEILKHGVSLLAAKTLIAPLVTEKTAHLSELGVYAFRVAPTANRVAVREAFRELYKVTPTKVNIVRVHGKERSFGRFTSRQEDWKKALVTVPSGTRVDVFTL